MRTALRRPRSVAMGARRRRGDVGSAAAIEDYVTETTRTVTLTTAMNTQQKQSAIDAIGRYLPPGVVVTVRFENGTHTIIEQSLTFEGFFGGGRLDIVGNPAEADTQHTDQAATLDGTSVVGVGVLRVADCGAYVCVKKLRVKLRDGAPEGHGLDIERCANVLVQADYFESAGTTGGNAIYVQRSRVTIENCMIKACKFAINAQPTSVVHSNNNSTHVTSSFIARAAAGSYMTQQGSQPTGSAGSTSTYYGGYIP